MDTTEIAALNGLYAAIDRMAAEPIDVSHAVSAGIGVSLNGGLCVSVNIEADGRPGTVWSAYRCDSGVHAEGSSAQEAISRLETREAHLDAAGRALLASGFDVRAFLGGLTVEDAGKFVGRVYLTEDLKCHVSTASREDVVRAALKAAGIALA